METLGVFPDGEWDCIGRMFEDDGNINGIQSIFHITPESEGNKSIFHSLDSHNYSNFEYMSQESSDYYSNFSDHTVYNMANLGNTEYNLSSYLDHDHVLANSTSTSMDFCIMDEKKQLRSFDGPHADIVMEENVSLKLKRMLDESELEEVNVEDKVNSYGNPKKKPCILKDNTRSKKNQKVKVAEESNEGSDGHSSSSYTSEEDNNINSHHQENNVVATSASKSPMTLNLNGKSRASRGSATDPQSLYARKRRERINERLKILQNLVPNGTKVDISTMLEEAVHYVKFLQLQIKLLSSDELWMYAPIAYNGLDIGLNLIPKNSPTL